MNRPGLSLFFLICFVLLCHASSDATDFPYRKFYPDVPVLDLDEVKRALDQGNAVIVDMRSPMEFQTIRVKDARNIDFSVLTYLDDLQQVAAANPGKQMIVYDNGINSVKCYIAAQDAMDSGVENIHAYDGGIQAWAEKYPQDILLMGKQLQDPVAELIPYDRFEQALLDFESFKQKVAASANPKIIDARAPKERIGKIIGLEEALPIPLDKLIRNIIEKGHMKEDQLFIYDNVGGEVRWLMYYLEKNGYTNYFFIKGGATAVINEQKYSNK